MYHKSNKPDFSFWNKNALSYGEEMKDDLQEINVDNKKHNSCYVCGHELIWGGDHDSDLDEVIMETNLSWPTCNSFVMV